MIVCRSRSRGDTEAVAAALAQVVRPRDIIVLSGEMGAGKTAFTSGFARALGVEESDAVSSPTFTLVHSHATGRFPLVHADLYRLNTMGEVADLGLAEQADLGAVVVVEWGDVAGSLLGSTLCVQLSNDDEDDEARTIEFSVVGHAWDSRWERLRSVMARWADR